MPTLAEQELLQSLNDEAIAAYGIDMFYLPRVLNDYDPVFGNDPSSSFPSAYQLVTYLETVDGFGGDKDFIAKFAGLLIRDQLNFTVSRRMFSELIETVTGQSRPNEGDLVYFPYNRRCFQVTFVDKFSVFYPLGILPVWSLKAELFEYSNEVFSTGIPEIDRIGEMSQDVMETSVTDESGNFMETEDGSSVSSRENKLPGDDSGRIKTEADAIITWNENDPFSEEDS